MKVYQPCYNNGETCSYEKIDRSDYTYLDYDDALEEIMELGYEIFEKKSELRCYRERLKEDERDYRPYAFIETLEVKGLADFKQERDSLIEDIKDLRLYKEKYESLTNYISFKAEVNPSMWQYIGMRHFVEDLEDDKVGEVETLRIYDIHKSEFHGIFSKDDEMVAVIEYENKLREVQPCQIRFVEENV
ncbi:hypothetical protein [uncultured Staphylococcus sp.]|uniref:hypothetical protein n=1 Tax=uncultured Staphylococcus sp. TaxID=189668 RepID=UPI0025EAEEC8|nr:hypothetical protein [uncultured Staphylococcus sp.]